MNNIKTYSPVARRLPVPNAKKIFFAAAALTAGTFLSTPGYADDPIPSGEIAKEQASDALTGNWAPRVAGEKNGFTPFAVLYAEGFYNAAGGVKNSGWWNTLLDVGFELDFEKMGGPAGSSFFVGLHWVENRRSAESFADYTGAGNPVSGLMANDQLRVFNMYFAQKFDDKFSLKIGQIAADDDFMLSDYSGLFLNSAFGAMPSQVATPLSGAHGDSAAFPIYSVASPGLWVNWTPTDKFAWQTAVYYGGPGPDRSGNHGFDYEGASYSGVAIFSEIAYGFSIAARETTVKLGVAGQTGRFDNYKNLNDGTGDEISSGLFSLYAVQDITLSADSAGKPVLGAFWRLGWSPLNDRSVVSVYGDAGLNWFAPIPGREDDIAGIAVSCTNYANHYRNLDGGVAGTETTLELTYQAKITRWFTLQGDVQFLFNPVRADNSDERKTAVVLGLRSIMTF